MKVCVVGSGGREHALALVLGRTADVVVTPGNPGIDGSTDLPADAVEADLFVIGPEQPLVDGLADRLRSQGKRVFGPGADGAQVEGSKDYMKRLAADVGLPTASYGSFTEVEPALAFLRSLPGLYVIKTDGLAAGKGVFVTESLIDAEDDVRAKLAGDAFGAAGTRVIIEEGLSGPEVSLFAVCDGERAAALPPAQDFKRLGDGDSGPNTGGMGAWSPLDFLPADFAGDVLERFVLPTLAELRRRGIDYRGALYTGIMMTAQGPKLIEYNVRFGDPDGQVSLLRTTSDLAALLGESADGRIRHEPSFSDQAAVLVVAASAGYPLAPRSGDIIDGLDAAASVEGALVLCAGVARGAGDELVTAGGRVINVVGMGPDVGTARSRAYDAIGHISWPGMLQRTDIAADG